MILKDNEKIIWIVSVDYWTGKVSDVEVKTVNKSLFVGNVHDGKGSVEVSLYPPKSEYEKCGFDKNMIINKFKNSLHYQQAILKSIYATRLIW